MKYLLIAMHDKFKFAKFAKFANIVWIAVCFSFILSVSTGCSSLQANSHAKDAQTLLTAQADTKQEAGNIEQGTNQDAEEPNKILRPNGVLETQSSSTHPANSGAKAAQEEKAIPDVIPSPLPAPSNMESAPPKKSLTVEISITGDKKHGAILKGTTVAFEAGNTAFDLLQKVTKDNKIQMEFQGRGTFVYVQGIDSLYEFDEGAKSGWIYKVNGQVPDKGAGAYKISENDKIEWLYTLDLGKDVGVKLK